MGPGDQSTNVGQDVVMPNVTVYQPRKAFLIMGVIGMIVFPAFTVWTVSGAFLNRDGSFARPVLGAMICGGFWGSWTLLSLYYVVGYFRYRLYSSAQSVRFVGVFRIKTVPLAAVTRAVWRGWPAGGSIVLHSSHCRLAIYFKNFAGGGELAALLRAALPQSVQSSFSKFEIKNLLRSAAYQQRRERSHRRPH